MLVFVQTKSKHRNNLTSLQPVPHTVVLPSTLLPPSHIHSLNTPVNVPCQSDRSVHLINHFINQPYQPTPSIGLESMLSRGLKNMEVSVSEAPQQTAR